MKILHLALQAPYNEGWGYQENLLPKYQVQLGHDVTLVTTCQTNTSNGKMQICEPEDYISPDGFRVIRLPKKGGTFKKAYSILNIYDIYELLQELSPDFIMIHSLISFSSLQVKKYVRKYNPNCIVIADTHMDENNSPVLSGRGWKHRLLLFLWRRLNLHMRPVYKRVYGVSPRRTELAHSLFRFPKEMLDTLPAGANDDKIRFEEQPAIRRTIREQQNISDTDFLIVTGGKIDENKNIDSLMQAVAQIDRPDVKLLVFGNCTDEIAEKIEALAEHSSIRYIGWISSDHVYDYFLSADLVVFPGLHSVMWEQACAAKIPCVFHRLDGFDHFDVGGNCMFVDDVSTEGLRQTLEQLIATDRYSAMKTVAESEATDVFLYSNIAKKALEAYS